MLDDERRRNTSLFLSNINKEKNKTANEVRTNPKNLKGRTFVEATVYLAIKQSVNVYNTMQAITFLL